MKSYIMIIISLVLVITFQNCDRVAFEAPDRNAQSDLSSEQIDDEEVSVDPILEPEPVAGTNPPSAPNPGTGNPPSPVVNPAVPLDPETTAALADCESLKNRNLELIASGSSIVNHMGSLRIKSERIETIQNSLGSLQALGIGANASIGNFLNTSGSTLICNMDIELIDGTQGSIRIVGGNIGKITGSQRGSITIYNGSVGELADSSGSVNVKHGDIGSIKNHTGSVTILDGEVTGAITNHTGSLTID